MTGEPTHSVMVSLWTLEDNSGELVLFLHLYVGPSNGTKSQGGKGAGEMAQ